MASCHTDVEVSGIRARCPGPDACRQTVAPRGPTGRNKTERKGGSRTPPITKTYLDVLSVTVPFSASPYVVLLVFLYLYLCGFIFLISLYCILVSCCIYIPFISMLSQNTFQLSYCCVIVVFDRDQIMYFLIISDSNVFLSLF